MAIEQALSKQAEKVRELKPFIDSTVATKTTFLMPFVNNVLGYDVSDPREVRPEYPVGNGESVDFAIVDGSDFRILVLCESIQHSLSSMRRDQLVRAIHALGADYGILGNGEFFEVFAKGEPVFNFNVAQPPSHVITGLKKLSKANYENDYFASASQSSAQNDELVSAIRDLLASDLQSADPELVDFLAAKLAARKGAAQPAAQPAQPQVPAMANTAMVPVDAPVTIDYEPTPPTNAHIDDSGMPWVAPRRKVQPDEVFFSTTDARGVIQEANNVFVDLSHYSRAELIGAPHNIIRHPDIPGALFHTMWSALEQGIPFAGYMRNATADGGFYDVYATVTKLENGGYLSVRITPSVDENWALAQGIYTTLSDYEKQLKDSGYNRRTAASQGAEHLTELLNQLGIEDYEHLQWSQLPDEVAAREARSSGLPQRPNATGLLDDILRATHATYNELNAWMREQDTIVDLISSLAMTDQRLHEEIQAAVSVSGRMNTLDVTGPEREVLLIPLRVWMNMHSLANDYLEELRELLPKLANAGSKTRFHVALARLHTTMVAMFAAELIDTPTSTHSAPAIRDLCSALRQTLRELDDQAFEYNRVKNRVSNRIRSVKSIMEVPYSLIVDWARETRSRAFTSATEELVHTVSNSADGAATAISELASLVQRLDSGVVHDISRVRDLVLHIDLAAKQYQDTH